jgi:Cation transporting ATPase, C-terminus
VRAGGALAEHLALEPKLSGAADPRALERHHAARRLHRPRLVPAALGIAFELAFAAAVIYLPPLQTAFGTAALGWHELAPLTVFPVVVWGSDELRRWALRRRRASVATRWLRTGPASAERFSETTKLMFERMLVG